MINATGVKPLPPGRTMISTPTKPTRIAVQRRIRTFSPSSGTASAVANSGMEKEIATKLVPTRITVTARAGAEGRLFGSITSADVVEAVSAQTGIELDRRTLRMDEPIKALGEHSVPVRLHSDVEFPVTVDVVAR